MSEDDQNKPNKKKSRKPLPRTKPMKNTDEAKKITGGGGYDTVTCTVWQSAGCSYPTLCSCGPHKC